MTSSWRSKYTRVYCDFYGCEPRFTAEVVREGSGNCWNGFLYNYSTGQWELRQHRCGARNLSGRWSLWESWDLVRPGESCPPLEDIMAQGILVYDRFTGWQELNPVEKAPVGSCWSTGGYTFHTHSNREWHAHTPNE
jgi:hypothetical protein